MSGSTIGNIRQTLGEILARVDEIKERATERQITAREFEERINMELRTIKHEARNQTQILSGRLELQQVEIQKVGAKTKEIEDTLIAIQGPVDQWIAFHRKLSSIGVLAISMFTVLWAIIEPIFSSMISHVWDLLLKLHVS